MFVGYVLAAVRSADPRGGLCCGRYTMVGYAGRPFGVSGPCSHRSGTYVETSAGLPADVTWIGDKPGLETCEVSQVVVCTHVGFRLKSAEHMSCPDAKWWKHV